MKQWYLKTKESKEPSVARNRAWSTPEASVCRSLSADNTRGQAFVQLILQQVAESVATFHQCDPARPEWASYAHYPRVHFGNNVDTRYLFTRVDSRYAYRIWGRRNTVAYVDVQLGRFGVTGDTGPVVNHFDLDGLTIEPDGGFEVVLSKSTPAGWTGDWWELTDDTEVILLRQVMLDWLTERDAEIQIEIFDAVDPLPSPTAEMLSEFTDQAVTYFGRFVDRHARYHDPESQLGQLSVNEFVSSPFAAQAGLPTQLYDWSWFEVEPGEALVLEVQVPGSCRYWGVQLNSQMFVPIDFPYRQSSLNAHQVTVDEDGRARFVVSEEDPGVPNWLDTAGHRRGVMMFRWDLFDSHDVPTVTKVPFEGVRALLPSDTPQLSPAQRRSRLAQRRRAILRRLGR